MILEEGFTQDEDKVRCTVTTAQFDMIAMVEGRLKPSQVSVLFLCLYLLWSRKITAVLLKKKVIHVIVIIKDTEGRFGHYYRLCSPLSWRSQALAEKKIEGDNVLALVQFSRAFKFYRPRYLAFVKALRANKEVDLNEIEVEGVDRWTFVHSLMVCDYFRCPIKCDRATESGLYHWSAESQRRNVTSTSNSSEMGCGIQIKERKEEKGQVWCVRVVNKKKFWLWLLSFHTQD